ncbi:MAG TPA: ABC transporter permease [Mobilitalea sp.]|nr:ABC transporter permease [Mobilitalea sp.]
MSLFQIYKVELLKILKRPITYLLLINYILPAFYTISIVTNAKHMMVQGTFDPIIFSSVNWNMLTMVGLLEVLFAVITAQIFAYEFEKGQLKLLVVRVGSRKKLLLAKILTIISLLVLTYLLFYVFCILLFYVFITKTQIGGGKFSLKSMAFMLQDLIYIVQMFIVSSVVLLLSFYFKSATTVMLGIGLTSVLLILQFFPTLKYFVPAYLATALSHSQISVQLAAVLCGLYFIIALVILYLSFKKFEKADIR